jgi:Fe-S cluster biosynthesis and repair protein YggX
MSEVRIIHCIKLNKDLPGLDRQPVPGELGKKIYDNVSKEGFKMFLDYFKLIVNEHHLDLSSPESDKIFLDQMEEFFFGQGGKKPNEFVEQK